MAEDEGTNAGVLPKNLAQEASEAGVLPNSLKKPVDDVPQLKIEAAQNAQPNSKLEIAIDSNPKPIASGELVSLKRSIKDPTENYSPRKRFNELYTSSRHSRAVKNPKGYTFGNTNDEVIIRLKSRSDFEEAIKSNMGKNPDEIIKQGINSETPEKFYTYYNEGGLNKIYLVHKNPLPSSIKPGSKEHIEWAIEHGENLIVKKVPKKIDIKEMGEEKFKELVDEVYADDVMNQVLDDLAMDAKLNGKPFIRTAKSDFIKGEQEFLKGPTAADLREAQDIIENGGKFQNAKFSIEEANKILNDAGFVKNGQIEFERLDNTLNALENFYIDGHNVARNFRHQYGGPSILSNKYRSTAQSLEEEAALARKADIETNPARGKPRRVDPHIDQAKNKIQNQQPLQNSAKNKPLEHFDIEGYDKKNFGIVGFDFNHGVNVIWNPKEQMFVVIDR